MEIFTRQVFRSHWSEQFPFCSQTLDISLWGEAIMCLFFFLPPFHLWLSDVSLTFQKSTWGFSADYSMKTIYRNLPFSFSWKTQTHPQYPNTLWECFPNIITVGLRPLPFTPPHMTAHVLFTHRARITLEYRVSVSKGVFPTGIVWAPTTRTTHFISVSLWPCRMPAHGGPSTSLLWNVCTSLLHVFIQLDCLLFEVVRVLKHAQIYKKS